MLYNHVDNGISSWIQENYRVMHDDEYITVY